MAKVFTVDIRHKSANYAALVTVRAREKEHVVHVNFFDHGIVKYIPEGELSFVIGSTSRTAGGHEQVKDRDLFITIRETVVNYLKTEAVTK